MSDIPPHSPWQDAPEEPSHIKSKTPFQKLESSHVGIPLIPILIGVLALVVIGGGLFVLFRLMTEPPQGASFDVNVPQEILLGQPFTARIHIINNATGVLRDGKLALFLPPELGIVGISPDERVYQESLGDVGELAVLAKEIQLVAVSGTLSTARLQAQLTYSPPGANTQFEQSKTVDFVIGAPAIALDITTPDKVSSGGPFETKIKITNNSADNFRNVSLGLTFPPSYQLQNSSLTSTTSGTWFLDDLKRGESKTLTVVGSLTGQENDFANIAARLRREDQGQEYVIAEKTAKLNIAAPPLSLNIRPQISGSAVQLGSLLQYIITVRNNTTVSLENLVVKATLASDLFQVSSVQTNGVFNGVSNTIRWDAVAVPGLRRIDPGSVQTLSFTVPIKNVFPITRQSDKDFVLKILGSVESPTILPGISTGKTITSIRTETKVSGVLTLAARAYYRDPGLDFPSFGPYPPKVNQPTRYTVHWVLKNYATDMSRIEVSAFLDPYTHLVGTPKSNVSSTPIYNSASGQIVWKLDRMAATEGVLSRAPEVIFQIESTPPTSYIGTHLPLLRQISVRAMDDFTGQTFSTTVSQILSNLPDDPTPGNVDRTVKP